MSDLRRHLERAACAALFFFSAASPAQLAAPEAGFDPACPIEVPIAMAITNSEMTIARVIARKTA